MTKDNYYNLRAQLSSAINSLKTARVYTNRDSHNYSLNAIIEYTQRIIDDIDCEQDEITRVEQVLKANKYKIT